MILFSISVHTLLSPFGHLRPRNLHGQYCGCRNQMFIITVHTGKDTVQLFTSFFNFLGGYRAEDIYDI